MARPERMQNVPLFDHYDAPALAWPLRDLLETYGLKQAVCRSQASETSEKDKFIPAVAAERDRLMEQSPAQPHRPDRRIDQEPAQLSISLRMADDRDAADEVPFPFGDPEPIAVRSRLHDLPQEVGDVGLKGRVEAALLRKDSSMQADKGAQIAWAEVVPQGEGNSRIRAWLFESLHGRFCHDD